MYSCPTNLNPKWNYPFTCGKCHACKAKKAREWRSRLFFEQLDSKYSYFVTLTLRPEEHKVVLAPDGSEMLSLSPKHLKSFNKDLQKKLKYRYYAVGEYGTGRTEHPHYHLIIFTNDERVPTSLVFRPLVEQAWKKGRIHCTEATEANIAYTAGYTAKKITTRPFSELFGRFPEFTRMSNRPGLGRSFVQKLVRSYSTPVLQQQIKNNGDIYPTFRIRGQIWPLSPYIKTKLRMELGIPTTHNDRMAANPNYLSFHESQRTDDAEKFTGKSVRQIVEMYEQESEKIRKKQIRREANTITIG